MHIQYDYMDGKPEAGRQTERERADGRIKNVGSHYLMGSERAQCVTIAQRPSLDFLYKQWIKGGERRATSHRRGFFFLKLRKSANCQSQQHRHEKHTRAHIKSTGQLEVTWESEARFLSLSLSLSHTLSNSLSHTHTHTFTHADNRLKYRTCP